MNKMNYLWRSINLLNMILLGAVLFLASCIVLPLFNVDIKYSLPVTQKIVEIKGGEGEKGKEEEPVQSQTASGLDYLVIAEQNLFHPERKIPTDEKNMPKPEFILYGTLITDTTKIAYLEDLKVPHSTPGRGKRQLALHIGNVLSGYTLSEVYHDMVVMAKGDEKIELKVIDPSKPKTRETGVATAKVPEKPTEKAVSAPAKREAASITPEEKEKLRQDRIRELREKRAKTGASQIPRDIPTSRSR